MEVKIGARLKALRKARGLSQQDVADGLARYGINVHQTHISAMERNDNQPSIETFANLVLVMETNPAYLLGFTDDSRPVGELAQTISVSIPDSERRVLFAEMVDRLYGLNSSEQDLVNRLLARMTGDVVGETA